VQKAKYRTLESALVQCLTHSSITHDLHRYCSPIRATYTLHTTIPCLSAICMAAFTITGHQHDVSFRKINCNIGVSWHVEGVVLPGQSRAHLVRSCVTELRFSWLYQSRIIAAVIPISARGHFVPDCLIVQSLLGDATSFCLVDVSD
jgi:hypothetical protein